MRAGVRSTRAAFALLAALGAALAAASSSEAAPRLHVRYARVRHASCFALFRVPAASSEATSAGVQPYTENDGAASSGPAGGLTPQQLARAYEYEQGQGGGSGQTVAIVDAYDDPKIESDLAEFDHQYGLPACTTANGCFAKVGQTGSPTSLPKQDKAGWSGEIALDVETVHGVCPNCKILLVETNSETFADLAAGVNEAVALGATEVSNSYGGPESQLGSAEQAAYVHPGVVIVAASGDDGYYDWDLVNEGKRAAGKPEAPASFPSVVAVGGTSLHLEENGTRASETVWNNNGVGDKKGRQNKSAEGATGGGCSTLFEAQPWQQQDVPDFQASGCGNKRLAADVSAVGDPFTGFDIYDTDECGSRCTSEGFGKGWITIGGTSLSTPLITALYALAGGSGGLSYPALTLYADDLGSSLYDVTEGASGYCDGEALARCAEQDAGLGQVDCGETRACNAAGGLDGPSGVGAPKGLGAFRPQSPTPVIAPPSRPTNGTELSFNGSAKDPYRVGIVSYSWNWGDGSPASSGPAPTHTYASTGTYLVTLTVTDSYGLTGTSSTAVEVLTEAEQARRKVQEEEEEAKRKREEREQAEKRKQEEEAAKRHQEEEEAAAAARREAEKSPLTANLPGSVQPAANPRAPTVTLASASLVASPSGRLTVRVACPAGVGSCKGTLTLRTFGPVSIASVAKARATVLTLASASFTAGAGKVDALTLHLSAKARRLLAHTHRLRVRSTIVARDPAGTSATTQALATLRMAKAKRARR
jgi:PKD repeat protein